MMYKLENLIENNPNRQIFINFWIGTKYLAIINSYEVSKKCNAYFFQAVVAWDE